MSDKRTNKKRLIYDLSMLARSFKATLVDFNSDTDARGLRMRIMVLALAGAPRSSDPELQSTFCEATLELTTRSDFCEGDLEFLRAVDVFDDSTIRHWERQLLGEVAPPRPPPEGGFPPQYSVVRDEMLVGLTTVRSPPVAAFAPAAAVQPLRPVPKRPWSGGAGGGEAAPPPPTPPAPPGGEAAPPPPPNVDSIRHSRKELREQYDKGLLKEMHCSAHCSAGGKKRPIEDFVENGVLYKTCNSCRHLNRARTSRKKRGYHVLDASLPDDGSYVDEDEDDDDDDDDDEEDGGGSDDGSAHSRKMRCRGESRAKLTALYKQGQLTQKECRSHQHHYEAALPIERFLTNGVVYNTCNECREYLRSTRKKKKKKLPADVHTDEE